MNYFMPRIQCVDNEPRNVSPLEEMLTSRGPTKVHHVC